MDSILVKGNGELNGKIAIAGAKNAALTLMPATLLTEEPLTLTNAPRHIRLQLCLAPFFALGGAAGLHGFVVRMLRHFAVPNRCVHRRPAMERISPQIALAPRRDSV